MSGWERVTSSGWNVADEADAARPLDPGEERGEGPGAGVGVVEVLEDERDRPPLAEPDQDAEDPLEQASLAALRRGDRRALGQRPGPGQPGVELRDEPEAVLDPGTEQLDELVVGRGEERGPDRPEDRRVRLVGAGGDGPAAEHRERLGKAPTSRVIASVRKRLAPMPPVPSIRTVVGTPPMAASSAGAIRANADSRPTNFALVNPAGMAANSRGPPDGHDAVSRTKSPAVRRGRVPRGRRRGRRRRYRPRSTRRPTRSRR